MTTWLQEFVKTEKRLKNKRNQKRGQRGQEIAALALERAGFSCVRPIETGWRVIQRFDPKRKQMVVVKAWPREKVDGDFTAVEPGSGRAVRVEVKAREGKLLWSDLEAHQVEALDAIVAVGGIGLIAWVCGMECRLYRWPVGSWGPGKSMKWDQVSK